MRTALNLSLLVATLAPTVTRAQSITPTESTILLYEQAGGFLLGAEKRVYTNYFNSARTRFIGVEVALDYPAVTAGFELSIGCQMSRPDGRVISGIWKIGMTIQTGSTHAVDANIMFGAGKDGWQTGIYKVTCAATKPLGETFFQISPGPSLLGDTELRLKEVKFFPTGSVLMPPTQREYRDRFLESKATRIGIELTFLHPASAKGGAVPIDCYVLPGAGRILGVMHTVYEFEAAATSGSAALGIGWDQPGQWSKGDYLVVCQIHGRPISVERFLVW